MTAAVNHLLVAPVLPAAWAGFDAVRRFRGVRYTLHVERRGPGDAVRLVVDGKPVEGNVIPLPEAERQDVQVSVQVGR